MTECKPPAKCPSCGNVLLAIQFETVSQFMYNDESGPHGKPGTYGRVKDLTDRRARCIRCDAELDVSMFYDDYPSVVYMEAA